MLTRFIRIAVVATTLSLAADSQGVITTVAGTDFVFPGNGKPALTAPLAKVFGIAADQNGTVYFSATTHAMVMKVTTDGTLTVVAGNGIRTFSGDNGLALHASLEYPLGLAVDTNGNVYVADQNSGRIRKITPDGTISTAAGNGGYGYTGDGVQATNTKLQAPTGVAVDKRGNIFIADAGNNRIRKVTTAGVITTVAGDGKPRFTGDGGPATKASLNIPQGVAVDTSGNLYIADYGNSRIRKVTTDGMIHTIAGNGQFGYGGDGGPAVDAVLDLPKAVTVDTNGNVYIADTSNQRIRLVTPAGMISTLCGTGVRDFQGDGAMSTSASLADPQGIAVDAVGNVYVADFSNFRVRKIALTGIITTFAGNGQGRFAGDGGNSSLASLDDPQGVAVDRNGVLYIADTLNNRVRKVTADLVISTVAGNGQATFAGDNGSALQASIDVTRAVAVDANGDIYLVDHDNNRVRKVSSNGTISTVAGNGQYGYSGDNIPAVNAALNGPSGLALDSGSNLFIADAGNSRVRKVSTTGQITTVAGTGAFGFSGDGGDAKAATLSHPSGIAVDGSGNLYIADKENHRIRKVTLDGTISTIAGTGPTGGAGGGFSGDGGTAKNARLNNPVALSLDGTGNLYVVDFYNYRIRKISPDDTITTVAGNGQLGYSGDGGSSINAALNNPAGVAVDTAGRIYIADAANDRIRMVLTAVPSIQSSASSLSLLATSTGPPTPVQTVNLSSSLSGAPFGVPFEVETKTKDGGSWIRVNPLRGVMPASLDISVDPASLSSGSYSGTVTITPPIANPSNLTIAVNVQVATAAAAVAQMQPPTLSYSFTPSSSAASQVLKILNTGGGSLSFKAVATTIAGGKWLTVSPNTGSATPDSPASVNVTANPAGLGAGTYSGEISIVGTQVSCTVTMIVNASQQTLLLSQQGFTFTTTPGGGTPPHQEFGILNTGQGPMPWSITPAAGSEWLTVSQRNGTSDPAAPVPLVQVRANPAGLAEGTYYGLLVVNAPTTENSPQYVSVVFRLVPPARLPSPIAVQPSGLIFTASAGGVSPASQNVLVYDLLSMPTSFGSAPATYDGGNWLLSAPTKSQIVPSQPTEIVVQPNTTGLSAGIYYGALTLVLQNSGPRTVRVLLVLTQPEPAEKTSAETSLPACVPKQLLPQITSLDEEFAVPAGYPAAIEVQVVDNCGNPVSSGTVTADFSNTDPTLNLVSLGNGTWSQTWTAQSAQSQVTVTVTATYKNITGTYTLTGGVQPNMNQPFLVKAANSASLEPQSPLSPGSLVSIFGAKLAQGEASSPLPLPPQLAESQAIVRGENLPIAFANEKQINAQIPYDLPVNSQLQLYVMTGSAITTPLPLTIAVASPAIFTKDQSGHGQGVIRNANNKLTEPGNEAKAGDHIVIYCSGLGAVSPPVVAGVAAPASPLSHTTNQIKVTIGNVPATVEFAALVPGQTGLYQVKAIVPNGLTPGGAVQVLVSAAGQTSPPVTMAIR